MGHVSVPGPAFVVVPFLTEALMFCICELYVSVMRLGSDQDLVKCHLMGETGPLFILTG